jgi:hypothetical protein
MKIETRKSQRLISTLTYNQNAVSLSSFYCLAHIFCFRNIDYVLLSLVRVLVLSWELSVDTEQLELSSVAVVRNELCRPTDRPPLVGEVSGNLCGRGCCVVSSTNSHGRYSRFSRPEPLLFHSSSSSVILTRLSGPR